jgi:hypothetical protein
MRTNRLFWGVVIILLGTLLLLQNLGLFVVNIWTFFWPLFLIVLGVWFILGPMISRRSKALQHLSVPLESARGAAIEFNHGAGRLRVNTMSTPGVLLEGDFVGGIKESVDFTGDQARIKLSADAEIAFGFPWAGGHEGFQWDVKLADHLPLDLVFNTGAGESQIDLYAAVVRSLVLKTGASSTVLTLPHRAGHTHVDVQAGAASVMVRVPEGVAGRIIMKSGLVGTKIDTNRFPLSETNYETPGFENAENRVEIRIEAGVGSIEIGSA